MRWRAWGMTTLSVLCAAYLAAGTVFADVCDDAVPSQLLAAADSPLGVPPQVLLASTPAELSQIVQSLGIPAPGMLDNVVFSGIKVLVVVGEARTNGCRSTEFRCVVAGGDITSVQAVVRETYPGCGCTCTMNYRGNAVFFVAVSDRISSATLLTQQNRFNCSSCLPCPVGTPKKSAGSGDVVVGQVCH